MRRILTVVAAAVVTAGITLGFLYISGLLRLDNWPRWAVGVGLFATGGLLAGDIWWREFQALWASRREHRLKRSAPEIRPGRPTTRVRRRVRAARRRLRSSKVLDGVIFVGALLLLFAALLVYANEDYAGILSSMLRAPTP